MVGQTRPWISNCGYEDEGLDEDGGQCLVAVPGEARGPMLTDKPGGGPSGSSYPAMPGRILAGLVWAPMGLESMPTHLCPP